MDFIYSVPVSATAACYSIKINNRSRYVTTYFRGKFYSVLKFVHTYLIRHLISLPPIGYFRGKS